jgi:hypothetical protein
MLSVSGVDNSIDFLLESLFGEVNRFNFIVPHSTGGAVIQVDVTVISILKNVLSTLLQLTTAGKDPTVVGFTLSNVLCKPVLLLLGNHGSFRGVVIVLPRTTIVTLDTPSEPKKSIINTPATDFGATTETVPVQFARQVAGPAPSC